MNTPDNSLYNIGPDGIRSRFVVGIIMAIVTVGVAVLILVLRWSSLWGILVFFPLFGAFLGFLQANKKTCIALASMGQCNLDKKVEKIEDEQLKLRLKERGNLIVTRSVLFAAILTAIFIIILEIM